MFPSPFHFGEGPSQRRLADLAAVVGRCAFFAHQGLGAFEPLLCQDRMPQECVGLTEDLQAVEILVSTVTSLGAGGIGCSGALAGLEAAFDLLPFALEVALVLVALALEVAQLQPPDEVIDVLRGLLRHRRAAS